MVRMLSATLGALIVAFALTVGGEIEGALFPVASDTTFGVVEPVTPTAVRVYGDSEKRRDCDFVRLEFRTQAGTVAPVHFEEGTVDRRAGDFGFGPWIVQMTPEQLANATVMVYHRCHGFWVTQSRWYP